MSENEDKLKDKILGLSHARELMFEALSRFTKFIDNFTDTNKIYELQARFEKIQFLWNEFSSVQADLEIFDKTSEHQSFRYKFEDEFFASSGAAKAILEKYFTSIANQNQSPSQNRIQGTSVESNANLPKIKLPEFYGSYDMWMQFADTFRSLIHEDSNISKIHKFWYLKSCIKGDAANLLNALEVSEINYDKAWAILIERYENKRIIIQTHMKALFAIPNITKESSSLLRNLIDTCMQHLRALESLGLPVKSWDTVMIFHLSSKLDFRTHREWEDFSLRLPTITPSLDEFIKFLNNHCQVLDSISHNKPSLEPPKGPHKKPYHASGSLVCNITETLCILCKKSHFIYSCAEFLKLSPQDRLTKIRKLHACTNCLRPGHSSKECRNAYSCKICSARHNSLLHLPKSNFNKNDDSHNNHSEAQLTNNQDANNFNNSQTLSVTNSCPDSFAILLSTARVFVFDACGKPHECRALLDNCSQSNFITQDLFNQLKLKSSNISHSVEGFGNKVTKIFTSTSVNIKSTINNFNISNIHCLITDKITRNLPEISFHTNDLHIPDNIVLADVKFNKSSKIDMLIGASIFWKLICVGQIVLPNDYTILQKTQLGWIISGPIPLTTSNSTICNLSLDLPNISQQLEKFWTLEECTTKNFPSQEEVDCETHFLETVTRNQSGSFVVSLPFKENIDQLGNSFDIALKRFLSTEKRLNCNLELKSRYNAFMLEYEKLGHMSKIQSCDNAPITSKGKEFFLPHHGVFKDSSSTTKLRVVFDGSAKSSTGISLNDTLKVGGKLQDDLMNIVIRFRTFQFAFTADIEKMYRCILVNKNQRCFQKILWRYDSADKIDQYELNTLTYGTSSAAFLAIRCLQRIAEENQQKYPHACHKIKSCFYVDDFLSGCNTIEEGKTIIEEVSSILLSAGFNLRKWVASNNNILNDIEKNDCSSNKIISDDKTVKTLGLVWNSSEDIFTFSVNTSYCSKNITKRSILAITSQIFDPMGLIGPCVIKAKILIQYLWQTGLDWDESIPMYLHEAWFNFCEEMPAINTIKIPRHIIVSNPQIIELHGFSDASMKAYGACCYLRSINSQGEIMNHIICAKSRVAPLKTISLPRLELCAAVLLVRLAQHVISSLQITIHSFYYWTDSTIVLSWISLQPNQLTTFVANRISEIQQSTEINLWRHISSEMNPADIISRGLSPSKLKDCSLWWSGPPFLKLSQENWPENIIKVLDVPELKPKRHITLVTQACDTFSIDRFSAFTKLQRVISYCLRFLNNCRARKTNIRYSGRLSKDELYNSKIIICKLVQAQHFPNEFDNLKKSHPLPSKSPIIRLNPFLDENQLIRVGGRIINSDFIFNTKHPILLPSHSHLTKLIILYEHQRLLHAGAQTTLSSIRLNFWPINGRSVVQKILRNCVVCFKANPTSINHHMGNLPKSRVTPQRPFYSTGVDFAGPFMVKDGKAKNRTLVKCYLCVFICFTTKAVHLELAGDLSSEAFLNCLKRFISRRGICKEIWCDNGTNFVGAANEIKNILIQIKRNSTFVEFLEHNNISWHFSPPYGPNFGGLWEAAVKSSKFHIKRVIGNSHLTYESFLTVVVQIEAILNSRPLLPLSSDPNDLNALTPSHFLIGEPLIALPQEDVTEISENRVTQFKRLQQQLQHFWKRWSNQYISSLQERSKWNKQFPDLQEDNLVLIKDENSAPLCWKMGRIIKVFPGSDNVTRVVEIKTSNGTLKRPISKVCALPLEN